MVNLSGKINTNKKRSNLENIIGNLFFSLVDYRNNLFVENKIEKIIKFYYSFNNNLQLINWMRERPKGASYINEVEGDNEIVVVIPTADFNGNYARSCREEIFKGLHIIYIESGEIPDPYFNYAHNCNVGIRKAMEYNPKWIVLSNDDMYKIDDVKILTEELKKLDPTQIDAVYTGASRYHSIPEALAIPRKTFFWANIFAKNVYHKIFGQDEYERIKDNIKKNYNIKTKQINLDNLLDNVLYVPIFKYTLTASFGIFSFNFINHIGGKLFDETFINGGEDSHLAIELSKKADRSATIKYNIGDYIGSSLGQKSKSRWYRDLVNSIYKEYIYKDRINLSNKRNSRKKNLLNKREKNESIR